MTATETAPLSLDVLDAALTALDPTGAFQGVSYNLAPHNTLPETMVGVHALREVVDPSCSANPSPLQDAILQAIAKTPTLQDGCYIDILHLSDDTIGTAKFFEPIIKSIVSFIKLGSSGATPVIRYLVGETSTNRKLPQLSGFMKELYGAMEEELLRSREFSATCYCNFAPSFDSRATRWLCAWVGR